MSYNYSYTFPALRGLQAGQIYYVAMCPLKLLPKLFLFDEAEVPPELRAQRTLNAARIPEIARYMVHNRRDYAFSAITVSIDGEVEDIGKLVISMTARFIINDGQHRRAAIEMALAEQPDLADETIAVVFYLDAGLKRSQQLFADLNKHAIRPTKSIGILYDYRDPLSCLVRDLIDRIPLFKDFTEKEKTTISNRSTKLFTMSGIYQATGALLGKDKGDPIRPAEADMARSFWSELANVIPEWGQVLTRQASSAELRRDYVHAHSVTLHAMGLAGRDLLQLHPSDWQQRIKGLRQLDWSRSNTHLWEGRAMSGGQMSKARQNVQLTANLIKTYLGLPLLPDAARLEDGFFAGTAAGS
jgi:DNA sulfur modification protein DndB